MTARQLHMELKTRFDKSVSSADTIRASLYKAARANDVFVRTSEGKFGLLEWKTAPAPASDQSAGTGKEDA